MLLKVFSVSVAYCQNWSTSISKAKTSTIHLLQMGDFFSFVFMCKRRISKLTRAPRGTDRSPEYNEYFCYKLDSRVKNLTKEWNEKHQHFITHASRSLLWIQFVAVAFQSEEENFWRGPPVTYVASPWICPWADMANTSLCMCQAMSTSSLPSFVNIH